MSPTSYQTAPPRNSIIATARGAVKPRERAIVAQFEGFGVTASVLHPTFETRVLAISTTCKKPQHPIEDREHPNGIAWIVPNTLSGFVQPQLRLLSETGGSRMAKKEVPAPRQTTINEQPRLHQRAGEIQAYGPVSQGLTLELEEPVRLEMTEQLNLLLADTMTLRDLYKKSHWQVSGATFYQLHLLFDKHYGEQSEIVDTIAERIQLLGGISIAMAPDVAETTRIPRPPKGREEVPVQLSRLLDAHEIIITHCRELAELATKLGDPGTNDLVVSDVLRTNELQVWFLSEHLVDAPLVEAEPLRESA